MYLRLQKVLWIFSKVKYEVNSVSRTLFLVSVPNFVKYV